METSDCHGYNCSNTKLIKAHIIPRGFARVMMDGHKHNIKITIDNVGMTQHGIYDPNILCNECDNKLGEYDDYALDICRRFPKEHVVNSDGLFEMANVDGDLFSIFVLSVLWRASITSRQEFRKVALGAYETEAQSVIYKGTPLNGMPSYQLLVARYTSAKIRPERNYTSPTPFTIAGLNGWGFALGGFRVMAKIDPRPLPNELGQAIVNGSTRLVGAFVNYDTTTEGLSMLNMAWSNRARLE